MLVKSFNFFSGYNIWSQHPIDRPIDETYPEFYNTNEFVFIDVTEVRYDLIDGRPYKVMLFRSIEEGDTIEGNRIYSDHSMWNFPDIM